MAPLEAIQKEEDILRNWYVDSPAICENTEVVVNSIIVNKVFFILIKNG